MITSRRLTISVLLVLAVIGFNPVAVQAAAPGSPGSDCVWSEGYGPYSYHGVYSCSRCDYFYELQGGTWAQVDSICHS